MRIVGIPKHLRKVHLSPKLLSTAGTFEGNLKEKEQRKGLAGDKKKSLAKAAKVQEQISASVEKRK